MKLWGGRFSKAADETIEAFTASLPFDQRMALHDVRASIAHVRMLGRCKIIPAADAEIIEQGLREILGELESGALEPQGAEDIHSFVEQQLTARIGPVAGRLHTARSRNDQVATDERLYLKEVVTELHARIQALQRVLVRHAEAHTRTVLPGLTHMQHAQPIVLAHHLLAYFWMLEEIVLWNTREFGFVELDDSVATGSSIMPQKKNPDVAELVRGKTGRVCGSLSGLLIVMKGLPLAYNSDMQEDKGPLFDSLDTVSGCLAAMSRLLETATFRPERMAAATRGDFSTATDLADYLVRQGMPFREAHGVVGRIVRWCEENGKTLEELDGAALRGFSEQFAPGAEKLVTVAGSVDARRSSGGTSPEQVERQLAQAKNRLEASERQGTGLRGEGSGARS